VFQSVRELDPTARGILVNAVQRVSITGGLSGQKKRDGGSLLSVSRRYEADPTPLRSSASVFAGAASRGLTLTDPLPFWVIERPEAPPYEFFDMN